MPTSHINTNILDSLIVGRVEPHIYAFTTETVPNYLKIGDTYRPVNTRIGEWRTIYPNLEHIYTHSARIDDDTIFRDFAVHDFLETEKSKARLQPTDIPDLPYYSREFFKDTSTEDIDEAIEDIKESAKNNDGRYTLYSSDHLPKTFTYTRGESYKPRGNQREVINNFKKAVTKGRNNLLMFAVMRFGKSFTSLCCAKEIDAKLVLVVSAKADVKNEWKKTVESIGNFEGYFFANKEDLLSDNNYLRKSLHDGKRIVLFLTLQDLQGTELKESHREVFNLQWDMLIVDETHFGARAKSYGQILTTKKDLDKIQINAEIKRQLYDIETLDDLDNVVKELKTYITLHLSGTPYRILMGSEFDKDDIIAFVQFSDIADAQENWIKKHMFDDAVPEWDNPYFGFPQMIRFAFKPNTASLERLNRLKAQYGATTSFSELFKPTSLTKQADNTHRQFVHKDVVLDFLKVIDGSKNDSNVLGFLDNERIKAGKLCRHMVFVLPYCASCDAMTEMLRSNSSSFRNLSDYEIINISGVDRDNRFNNTEYVKQYIADCEKNGKKTITLTVNRMLTGNTVPQWDTMVFLKQTNSPEEYDQAIFRLQNPFVDEYDDGNGNIVKYNLKPQTILVDFDPERVFNLQERKSQIYNVNTENNGNSRLRERIEKELSISPIITLDHNKLREVTSNNILDAVRNYAATRSMIDEASDMPIDMSMLDIEEFNNAVNSLNPIDSKKGLSLSAHTSESDDENDGDDVDSSASDTNSSSSTNNQSSNSTTNEEISDEKILAKKFATYYALILFFSFLSEDQVSNLEDIINVIDQNDNNKRIARNLGLSKRILSLMQAHMNGFSLRSLDYKIQNTNSISRDNSKTAHEKVKIALTKFGRMSESEIITPIRIADEMVSILPNNIFQKGPVLDIASKQGEFTFALIKRFGEESRNMIYSLCTSPLAYEFTRKVYSLLSLPIENVFSSYYSSDLIDISKTDFHQTLKDMNFASIIGNPPYNELIGTNDSNRSLSKQQFPSFVMASVDLGVNYVCLITPSRWFTGDAQDKSFIKLRQFVADNNHISDIINYPNTSLVFDGVEISGGVNYFLYDREHSGNVNFVEVNGKERFSNKRPLFEDGMDIIFGSSRNFAYVNKIKRADFVSLTTITQGRDAFGIVGKGIKTRSSSLPFDGSYSVRCKYEEIRYIDPSLIAKNKELADKWKIFISKGNGGAGLLSDNKQVAILGIPYIAEPHSVCTDSLIPIGNFDTEFEAKALWKYLQTRFVRFLVGILKTSQNLYQPVYQFVPIQNFTVDSDIDWSKSIDEIDDMLFEKYKFSEPEIEYIKAMIKHMDITNQ